MKRLFLAATAAVTVGLAASPVLAQPYGDQGQGGRDYGHSDQGRQDWGHNDRGGGEHDRAGGWSLDQRLSWLQNRIYQARRNGELSWQDARRAQYQLTDIRYDIRRERYRDRGQLSEQDQQRFDERLNRLADSIRWQRADEQNRRPWG
jgi:hypothetical protein